MVAPDVEVPKVSVDFIVSLSLCSYFQITQATSANIRITRGILVNIFPAATIASQRAIGEDLLGLSLSLCLPLFHSLQIINIQKK